MKPWLNAVLFVLVVASTRLMGGEVRNMMGGHVPRVVAGVAAMGRVPPSQSLELTIGLRLRNLTELTNRLASLYDPHSPQFHRYLTPDEFTAEFGPTEQEYQTALDFARANGLEVRGTHRNRLLVDVAGAAGDIERALQVNLCLYQHPDEPRTFRAPDREPSVDARVPALHISGLDDFRRPRQMSFRHRVAAPSAGIPRRGSGPSGSFLGKDFRAAYVPGTSLTGVGQTIGLFELDGYYASDITAYRTLAGLPNVPLKNVLVDGFNGIPSGRRTGSGNEEVALDIEMVISMAPGAAQVIVYEGSPVGTTAQINDLLNRMATDNLARQLSCSWGFDIDATSQQIFQEYAAQGQSFFLASGDSGAFAGPVSQPADSPYITVVGGTTLTTSSTGAWLGETTWSGSGGGISTIFGIPEWQRGVDMTLNGGSDRMRNLPDVALIAENVWVTADRGQSFAVAGTSIAAPLWAGLTALINQQGAARGQAPVGFLNPAIYAVARGADYGRSFRDITTGSNTTATSPDHYAAVTGYDLCTGWGTPNGTNLIEALLAPPGDALRIASPLGFSSQGPMGGPFSVVEQVFQLTNAGPVAVPWALGPTPDWLSAAPAGGVLAPGMTTPVQVSLAAAASQLLIGSFSAALNFTNLSSGSVQVRHFQLGVGNGGFEKGDLSYWTLVADTNNTFADSIDYGEFAGGSTIPGVADELFVHEGIYGAFLGQNTTLGQLFQTVPTVSGGHYLVSFWLDMPASGTPNEFSATWDGITLFDQVDMDAFVWTWHHYVVVATGPATDLEFAFRNDPNGFGLDEITVEPIRVPVLQVEGRPLGTLAFSWLAQIGVTYHLQSLEDFPGAVWQDVGNPITATDSLISVTDVPAAAPRQFYRLLLTSE